MAASGAVPSVCRCFCGNAWQDTAGGTMATCDDGNYTVNAPKESNRVEENIDVSKDYSMSHRKTTVYTDVPKF